MPPSGKISNIPGPLFSKHLLKPLLLFTSPPPPEPQISLILYVDDFLLDLKDEINSKIDISYPLFFFRKGIRFSKRSYNFVKAKFIIKDMVFPKEENPILRSFKTFQLF